MKYYFTFLGLCLSTLFYAQCATVTGTAPTVISGGGSGGNSTSYTAGTVVEYCFTITDYVQTSTNWVHSAIPTGFPTGSSVALTSTPPTDADGGNWRTINSSNNGNFMGQGFYYDTSDGSNNPFNNFGVDCTTCNLTFCFEVTMPSTGGPYSFMPMVDVNGDGTTGSWNNSGCDDDPVTPTGWPMTEFALPIDLIDFTASSSKGLVTLNWITANEVDFSHFEVETSLDVESFTMLSRLESSDKGSNTEKRYQLEDKRPLSKTVYYRLKMVDLDGRYDYSNIISVHSRPKSTINVYPNPAKENLFIDLGEQLITKDIIVTDMSGREVKRITSNKNTINSISVTDLISGVYTVLIETANGNIFHYKIVKK